MKISLVVVKGPHLGEQFLFAHHEHFLVGRAPVAHFRLGDKDPYVSRLHFVIEFRPMPRPPSSKASFIPGMVS